MNHNYLYQHFESHLLNTEIAEENEEAFVLQVVEKFMVGASQNGYFFSTHAENVFRELCDEVLEMLRKKTYGFHSIEAYRAHIRSLQK